MSKRGEGGTASFLGEQITEDELLSWNYTIGNSFPQVT
jgi:hypothetical protein